MIGKIINKIAGIFGVKIIRKKKKENKIMRSYKKPLFIDFLGPAGSGKTTFIKNINSERNPVFITQKEFISQHNLRHHYSLFTSEFEEILKYKIDEILAGSYSSYDKMVLLSYLFNNLREIVLAKHYNRQQAIAFDEGLLYSYWNAVEATKEKNRNQFDEIIKNHAVIYCDAPMEIVAERIDLRDKNENFRNPRHKVSNEKELHEVIQRDKEIYEERLEVFKRLSIPVLKINLTEDYNKNRDIIFDFISKITSNEDHGNNKK